MQNSLEIFLKSSSSSSRKPGRRVRMYFASNSIPRQDAQGSEDFKTCRSFMFHERGDRITDAARLNRKQQSLWSLQLFKAASLSKSIHVDHSAEELSSHVQLFIRNGNPCDQRCTLRSQHPSFAILLNPIGDKPPSDSKAL